ncbi:MAG: FG-GAP repeat protein [candidate division KSB1 bacterium]|nr:FG-GAP repeat protein [candidate division KSB1 bacterium]
MNALRYGLLLPGIIMLAAWFVSPAAAQRIIDFSRQPADIAIRGDLDGQGLGASSAIGDLNGDGLRDLVVGAPGGWAMDNANPGGCLYLLWPEPLARTDRFEHRPCRCLDFRPASGRSFRPGPVCDRCKRRWSG